jgi:predicted nuclease of predicted toxin-antitoxin system
MLRLLIDENINHRILRGLKSRLPELDFVTVRQLGLARSPDSDLLKWAAENQRVMLTHDRGTMSDCANQLLREDEPMAGVIIVPDQLDIGRAINDLELLIACSWESEFHDRIKHLPLRW